MRNLKIIRGLAQMSKDFWTLSSPFSSKLTSVARDWHYNFIYYNTESNVVLLFRSDTMRHLLKT